MRRAYPIILILGSAMSLMANYASAADSPMVSVTVDPEDCPELIEMSEKAADAYRKGALDAATQIEAGGPLEDDACIGDLRDFDVDFFNGFSNFKAAAIKKAKDQAIASMVDMACDAAQTAIDSAETLLSCNASAGISLNLSAGFGDINVSECLGQGDLDLDYDAGTYGNGQSGYSAGFNESAGSNTGNGNGNSGSGSKPSGWGGWLDD